MNIKLSLIKAKLMCELMSDKFIWEARWELFHSLFIPCIYLIGKQGIILLCKCVQGRQRMAGIKMLRWIDMVLFGFPQLKFIAFVFIDKYRYLESPNVTMWDSIPNKMKDLGLLLQSKDLSFGKASLQNIRLTI